MKGRYGRTLSELCVVPWKVEFQGQLVGQKASLASGECLIRFPAESRVCPWEPERDPVQTPVALHGEQGGRQGGSGAGGVQ